MAEEKIDSYVDRNGVKADTEFIVSSLRSVYAEFQKLEGVKIDLKGLSGLANLSPAMQQAKASADALSQATAAVQQRVEQMNGKSKEFTTVLLAQVKAQKEAAAAALLEAKTANEVAKAKNNEAKASKEAAKAKEQEAKLLDQATNDYLQLSKAYNEAALKAKNYFVTLGESNPITKEAVANAAAIGDVLKKADAAVGQYQRNVGNYKSAFDGLGFSFTQIGRELPSLAVSFQQFALAISNNLPMVADELAKAKKEIAGLKAEGKDAPSLFSRITGALLSWQLALSVGIALITAYAKEIGNFFSGIFRGKRSFDEGRESIKALSETVASGKQAYADASKQVTELRQVIGLAKEGFIDKEKAVKFYNETIGKTTGEVKTLDEAEKALQKNAQAYINFTLAKAVATAAFTKAANLSTDALFNLLDPKEIKKRQDAIDFFGSKAEKAIQQQQEGAKKQVEIYQSIGQFAEQFAAKIAKTFKFDFFGGGDGTGGGGQDDAAKKAKEAADRRLKALFEIQKIEFQRRIDFNQQIADDENKSLAARLIALEEAQFNRKRLIELEGEVEKQLGEKTADEKLKIEVETNDKLLRANREYYKQNLAIREKFRADVEKSELDARARLEKALEEGYKRFAKLEEDRTKKEKEEAKKREEQEKEANARKADLQRQLVTELTNLSFTLFEANLTREKNALQDQIDLLEQRKQKDIEVANQTIANTEERAAAIQIIEARAAAQKEQLQQRQRQLDQRKAEFDKAQSIARIVQETAIGLIKLTADPNPFAKALIPLFLAVSAAQLATVIATPIPRYFRGKNVPGSMDSYEGPAVVDDGGRPEAIIREDGSVEIGGNTPRITHVKKRDVILPDADMLINYVLAGHMGGRLAVKPMQLGTDLSRLEKGLKSIEQAVKTQPRLNLNASERGMTALWQFGANQTTYINDNTNW